MHKSKELTLLVSSFVLLAISTWLLAPSALAHMGVDDGDEDRPVRINLPADQANQDEEEMPMMGFGGRGGFGPGYGPGMMMGGAFGGGMMLFAGIAWVSLVAFLISGSYFFLTKGGNTPIKVVVDGQELKLKDGKKVNSEK